MTAAMTIANSPHRFVDEIRTPMLVVHGDRDYRVPIGEGLRLWAELAERGGEDGSMPHKFLYFPDENHWVLKPQHAKLWYEVVAGVPRHHGRRQGVAGARAAALSGPEVRGHTWVSVARGASRNAHR